MDLIDFNSFLIHSINPGKLINNVLGFDRLVAKQKEFRCSTRMRQKAAINQDRSPAKERELIQQKLYKIRKQEQKLAEQGIEFKCITLVDWFRNWLIQELEYSSYFLFSQNKYAATYGFSFMHV